MPRARPSAPVPGCMAGKAIAGLARGRRQAAARLVGSGCMMEHVLSGSLMLLLATALKLLAEVALLALVGRWLLGLLSGAQREQNFFYQVFSIVSKPVERFTRWLSPRIVLDRHIPLAAGVLLLSVWFVSTLLKVQVCIDIGIEQCR
jgi:hypothetical protein